MKVITQDGYEVEIVSGDRFGLTEDFSVIHSNTTDVVILGERSVHNVWLGSYNDYISAHHICCDLRAALEIWRYDAFHMPPSAIPHEELVRTELSAYKCGDWNFDAQPVSKIA